MFKQALHAQKNKAAPYGTAFFAGWKMGLPASLCSAGEPGEVSFSKKAFFACGKIVHVFLRMFKQALHAQKNKAAPYGTAFFAGWKMGFEPTTFGTTIRRSNLLNYIHRLRIAK
jgi:hypothetical protein